jgi:hypothetical protein
VETFPMRPLISLTFLAELGRLGYAKWTGIDERGRAIAEATMKAIRVRASQRVMVDALPGPFLM